MNITHEDKVRVGRSIVWKLLLPIPLICAAAALAAVIILPLLMRANSVDDAVDAAHRTVQQFQVMRAYYTREVTAKVLAHSTMHTSTNPAASPDTIPAPSTMVHELGDLLVGQGTAVRVYSPYPFPVRAGRTLDLFQQQAWDFVSAHPDQAFTRGDVIDGRPVVRVALADRMTDQACVNCHNATVGLARRDWKLGDVRGVMEVDSDVSARLHRDHRLTLLLLGAGIGGAVLLFLISAALARRISRPLRSLTDVIHRLAAGDTTVEVATPVRNDEVGTIAAAVEVFKRNAVAKIVQDEQLSRTNLRFDAALNNMSLGLCLCDRDNRVAVANRKFCDMFGLTDPPIGIGLRELIRLSLASGNHEKRDLEDMHSEWQSTIDRRVSLTLVQHLRDGRVVAVSHEPMADGGWVETFEDVTERQRVEKQITFMARHDALTSLPNRTMFNERLQHALAHAGRGAGAAVLCLDLDRFKSVNDTLGHPVGDELLRAVADRLSACVREVDTVARLGGDEFAVVQAGVGQAEEAGTLAARIVAALGEPYVLSGHNVVIGVSIGIALAPTDATGPERLLKCADMALYRAKTDGRGLFRFFECEMDVKIQARRALELDLRRALHNDEFLLHYQPLVDLRIDRVTSFEALLRWQHPERGLLPPDEFIPIAEESGLIVPLGEWVLRRACMDAMAWPDRIRVAVNLSPAQFRESRLVDAIRAALTDSGLPPSRLELEITESVLLQNSQATFALLHELHELGTPIAMDDFGTGYSSLSYLRSFPFDKIKIDRSFIGDLSNKDSAAHIVRAVTGLGISLGMSTTAEGVETLEQLRQLRVEGCTEVQGYLFSRPRPKQDIPAILEHARATLNAEAGLDHAAATGRVVVPIV